MGISVMIVHNALMLVKRVTCDIIERCHMGELTKYDIIICGYGVYELKLTIKVLFA